MKLALFGLFSLIYMFSGSMAQVLPHYNGILIAQDQKTPYINKISSRINTAFITAEQRSKEGVEILRLAENNFRQCEATFGGNPTLIGGLKGCLGRFTGMAMAQISALEALNRNNGVNDISLLQQNSNSIISNLRNQNLNSQLTNKHQSNEYIENINSRSATRSHNNESNEEKNLKIKNSIRQNSNESNDRKSSSKLNSRNKHFNKHRESNENRKDRSSNESY